MPNVTKPVPIDESSDVVHDDTTGGTDGNPHILSADTNHGNEAHAESYITSGGAPVQSVNGETGDVTVGGIPSGLVAMWSGSASNVPSGWALCDGTDGTPNLQDRFVVGAGNQYSPDDTGGSESVQLTIDEMPSHDHSYKRTTEKDSRGSIQNIADGGEALENESTNTSTEGGEWSTRKSTPVLCVSVHYENMIEARALLAGGLDFLAAPAGPCGTCGDTPAP